MGQLNICAFCHNSKSNHAMAGHDYVEKVDPTEGDTAYSYQIHNYEADPQSGAGNCRMCGRPKENMRHPHIFRKAENHVGCTCGKSSRALIHQMTRI